MFAKKLVLVSAIALASTGAYAMESLDDQNLADTTGQAGLDISIIPSGSISFSALYQDADGVPTGTVSGSTYTSAGAVVIGNAPGVTTTRTAFSIANSSTSGWLVKIDAGSNGTTTTSKALLNINVSSTGTTTIHTGDIAVAVPGASSTGIVAGATVGGAVSNVILSDMTIQIGSGTLMNIQLGNEDQGAMIKMTPSFTGGLSISNFTLNDAGGAITGGGIKVTTTTVKDCGSANCATVGANLGAVATIDADTNGLQVGLTSLGNSGNGGAYVKMAGIFLGNTAGTSIGDVEIYGLNVANTKISITGH